MNKISNRTRVYLMLSLLQLMSCNEVDKAVENKLDYFSNRIGTCSEYYHYSRTDDFIIGKLTLPTLKFSDTVAVIFRRLSLSLHTHFNGSILPDESTQALLDKVKLQLPITFRIDFPLSSDVPELESVALNDNQLCKTRIRNYILEDSEELILQHTLSMVNNIAVVFRGNINIPHFAEPMQFPESPTCGVPDEKIVSNGVSPLIYGGTELQHGEYPWMTAIYRNEAIGMNFICGGSLVSSRFVLTAAHCFQGDLTAEQIVVYLGLHNLANARDQDALMHQIAEIIPQPEYKAGLGFPDADLALLKMQQPVRFTPYIKPICLWNEHSDTLLIVNRTGVVAGWGSDEHGNRLSMLPKKVKTNIVSEGHCLRSSPAYAKITSPRTFCAGTRNGTGPCEGDSGGGLMIYRNGIWMLRGIISAGLVYEQRCILSEYTVFCDVAKHMPWLENYVGQQAICGKSSSTDVRTEQPWLVAVYGKTLVGLIFQCTGTLISSRSVLAPANCFDLGKNEAMSSDSLRVYLGRYDLNNLEERNVVTREVKTLLRHAKYSATDGVAHENDLALIQFEEPVSFTQYVKPICLWSETSGIVKKTATLASWDISKVLDESLTVPEVSEVELAAMEMCEVTGFNVSGATSKFLCTPRFGNNVDGILLMKRNERWFLRGMSTANQEHWNLYNSIYYRLYTDIAAELPWILSNMRS